jgi:iron-sulfur cluster repair protein YtfE (RIC family)
MAKQPPTKGKTAPKQFDAVQMLKADHRQMTKLFERFHAASGDEQSSIAGRLFIELEIHTTLEEELFYPAIQSKLRPMDAFETTAQENGLDAGLETEDEEDDEEVINGMELEADDEEDEDEELIDTAYEEHQAAKDLIEQLKTLDANEADFEELFNELEEMVIEHITGEEDVLFPLAVSELDVQALGLAMQRRRDDLSSSLAA